MTRFLIVPQWQGSPSARGMRLIDGAQAIAGDLPRAACTAVDVPIEAGESHDTGIRRYATLTRVRASIDTALAGVTEPVMLIGGDCGAAVGAIDHAASRHPDIAVVWFDAHADLHSPTTSTSGAFGGMALRAALGGVPADLAADGLDATRLVVVGAREIDDAEKSFIDAHDIALLGPPALADAEALADAVAATGASAVYVHIDLDVLDPAVITGVTGPVPFGCDVAEIVAAIGALRRRLPLAGSSICGFAPASPADAVEDMGTILRVIGALA